LRFARVRCLGLPHFADQLIGALVETHHRKARVIGLGVEIQDLLHPPDKFATDRRDTPLLFQPGFNCVFFRVRPTVSSEIASTIPTSTNRSASNCSVHRLRPLGGRLQAVAMRNASSFPCSFACPPGRLRSVSAASSPSSTNRLRVRSTVATPV